MGGPQRERETETESVKTATEPDCLTKARDSRCAESSKTRPPLYVLVTVVVLNVWVLLPEAYLFISYVLKIEYVKELI
jgi:hypothetical protein